MCFKEQRSTHTGKSVSEISALEKDLIPLSGTMHSFPALSLSCPLLFEGFLGVISTSLCPLGLSELFVSPVSILQKRDSDWVLVRQWIDWTSVRYPPQVQSGKGSWGQQGSLILPLLQLRLWVGRKQF